MNQERITEQKAIRVIKDLLKCHGTAKETTGHIWKYCWWLFGKRRCKAGSEDRKGMHLVGKKRAKKKKCTRSKKEELKYGKQSNLQGNLQRNIIKVITGEGRRIRKSSIRLDLQQQRSL